MKPREIWLDTIPKSRETNKHRKTAHQADSYLPGHPEEAPTNISVGGQGTGQLQPSSRNYNSSQGYFYLEKKEKANSCTSEGDWHG